MAVKVSDFASKMQGILDDYAEGASAAVERAVEETAKATLSEVRKKSPKRTGRYRKGWRKVLEKAGVSKKKTTAIIYNATEGSLVHLIENGHQKVGGGRVEGIPHVKPAEALAEELLPQLIKQELEEVSGS